MPPEGPRICEPGGKGQFFPLFDAEHQWPDGIRVVLYMAAMVYLFLGVSIVADKFVGSIEVITSKKRRVQLKHTGRTVTVAVWNGTVANLTLLALGSSAPEILLSTVEALKNDFHIGVLGPSTIVGSAAFNLFVIIAVCILAIPSPETRKIKETPVFFVTAAFSMFAYFWLVFIVQVSSPDVVDIWEAALTLALLPVLVIASYAADIGWGPFARFASSPYAATQDPADSRGISSPGDLSPPYGDPGPWGERRHSGGDPIPWDTGGYVDGTVSGGLGILTDEHGANLGTASGVLTFADDVWEVSAGLDRRQISVPVFRQNGTEGVVACKYRIESHTSVPGFDYIGDEGELQFANGVARQDIPVELLPKKLGEHSDQFQIIIFDAEGGAIFYPYGDGGDERCVLTVTILNENDELADQNAALRVSRYLDGVVNLDSFRRGNADWYSEIVDSLYDIGGEDGDPPSRSDWAMHLVSLPWKFFFALLVPPPAYVGGWISFAFCLGHIGALTAVVIDFAELFGCVTGIEDSITAITFVALGTSMPDLFASVSAARADTYADASIVNVTGSNSVNVFVGIGIPWTLSAIYWAIQGPTVKWRQRYGDFLDRAPNGGFIVPGGDLGFSVVAFSVAAFVALVVIRARRVKLGGELGGPFAYKVMSAALLISLWCFYIGLSIWKIVSQARGFGSQVCAILVAIAVLENILVLVGIGVYFIVGGKTGVAISPESPDLKEPPEPPFGSPPSLQFSDVRAEGNLVVPAVHGFEEALCPSEGPRQAGHEEPRMWPEPLRSPRAEAQGRIRMVGGAVRAPAKSPASRPISFTGAAMVCLALQRLRRAVRRRRAGLRPPPLSAGAPAEISRAPSFHSLESTPASGAGAGSPGATQSVGGRVGGWVADHTADCVALSVAGLAAAQLANRDLY